MEDIKAHDNERGAIYFWRIEKGIPKVATEKGTLRARDKIRAVVIKVKWCSGHSVAVKFYRQYHV